MSDWGAVNSEDEMTEFDRMVHAEYLKALEGRERAKLLACEQIARELERKRQR